MRILFFLLFPIFLSAQINRAYGVVEIGSFPTSSSTGPKFAYRPVDSSFYRWVSGNTWVKIIEPSIIPDTLYITEEIGTSYKISGDTLHLTPYLLKSDTSAMLVRYIERGDTLGMLSAYIRSAGWGLLKSAYTLRADSTLLATKLYAKSLPTYIIADRSVRSNGSNLVVGNFTDNGTKLQALLPFQFQQWTTAGRPTGVTGYTGYNTTGNGMEWYQGSRWAYALESTFARGTSTYVPHFDANGQLTQSGRIRWNGTQTQIYGSTNAFSTATKSLQIFSLNGVEMFWVNDNNQWSGAGITGSQGNLTVGSGGSSFPAININGDGGSKELFQHETSTLLSFADNSYSTIRVFSSSATNNFSKILSVHGSFVIGGTSAPRTFSVNGEARITDLTTDTPTRIVGADADGDIGDVTWLNPASNSLGIGTIPTQELDVNGDLWVRDSTRLGTTSAHSSITGLLTRDANGWVGLATLNGLKYTGTAITLLRKSLIDSLPTGPVAIDGNDNPLAFNFLNSFTVDFETTGGSITSDGDITSIESDSEIHLVTSARLDLTDEAKLSAPNLEGDNSYTIGFDGFYWNFVNTAADPDSAFTIITDGDRKLIRAHGYGNGYVDATYTGEYPGKYILATTANHNVMDYRIDRDTLVVDTNLSVGTLLYYTQNLHINLRMTALASTNSTITFPDASDSFRGKSIIIQVIEKDPGIYVPVINVSGGVSRLLYTSTTTTAPTDQATLTMDNATWPFFRTYKFTCLNTGTTPNYRWVLNQ